MVVERSGRIRGPGIGFPLAPLALGLLLVLFAAGVASAWEPEIRCHSGSPLLLEITVEEPEAGLTSVVLESDGTLIRYELPGEGEPIELKVSPFLEPGAYELELRFLRGREVALRRRYEIGFVDFVFGRDNFRFGNNADYESLIGAYSEILSSWLEEHFGEPKAGRLALLTDYMYSLFGSNPGRCYAFSGSQLRYWRTPELLPSYYDSAYDIPQRVRRQQREMNYLQLDVVYDTFVAAAFEAKRRVPEGVSGELQRDLPRLPAAVEAVRSADPQGRDVLERQVELIVERIVSGEPAAVGFIGPELHHSMLVYGFIRQAGEAAVDLLVANNWKSDEDLNLRSRDAETVHVDLREEIQGGRLRWIDVNGPRDRQPDRLFLVEVEEEYVHEPAPMEALLQRRLAELSETDHALLVVENAEEAWLSDGEERVTGYKDRRTRTEMEEVLFDRVKRNFRFEYPSRAPFWLEFTDDEGARVLLFSGGEGSVIAPSVPDDQEVQRRLLLSPGRPLLQRDEEESAPIELNELDEREARFR